MSKKARSAALASAVVAAALVGTAVGAGPWPGLAASVTDAHDVVYLAKQQGQATIVTATRGSEVLQSARLKGAFGVPAVTLNGNAGGLSVDGKLLVLAQPPSYETLRQTSRFLVLRTASLRIARTVTLKGDFGYDALSPDGRWL